MMSEVLHRIKRKWMKIRLQPIRVFCLHHVSDAYAASYMWEEDWTKTDVLKNFIKDLQAEGYTFISLPEAYEKIRQDKIRRTKYAVLTADDGFKSLMNILPWLEEQHIPITLFVNPKYIIEDGIGENTQSQLDKMGSSVTSDEIYLNFRDIQKMQSPLISYGYHGYEHLDEWDMDKKAFAQNVEKCMNSMRHVFPNVVPFYAHTYGHAKEENDEILGNYGLIPVYISGGYNVNDIYHINRELISSEGIDNL